MFKITVFLGLVALLAAGATARAAENCDTYFVAPGDTLRLISERYYGVRELSPIIYNANTDVIGEDPNTIEIGMELSIPCRDNMHMPQPTAFVALVDTPDSPTAETTSLFLAKAGSTPFIGEDNSGIIPEIIAAALRAGGFETTVETQRPEMALDVLRLSTAPNALLSFPWIMPKCDGDAPLSPQSAYLCQNYTFSDPLYEITLGIFTKAESPLALATAADAFAGKSICVPQFHTIDILEQNGVLASGAMVETAPDFATCQNGTLNGVYDAFVADYQSFGSLVSRQSGLADIPAFSQKTTLHAMAYTPNPAAVEVLGILNAGLKKILMSGEWFGIVNEHISPGSN